MEQTWNKNRIIGIAKEVIPDEIDCLSNKELEKIYNQVEEGTFVPQERIVDGMPGDISVIINVVSICFTAISILLTYYRDKKQKDAKEAVFAWIKNDLMYEIELSKNQGIMDFIKEHYDEIIEHISPGTKL